MSIFLKLTNFRFFVSPPLKRFYSKRSKLDHLLKIMPKEPKHVAEAQKQRIKLKQKSSKYVPGRVTVQILGTGAKGAPRSVYLFSDQSRYLFNCGEGTQRLAHEHKTKLAKLEHIFVTQLVWKNIGGLPGTALTIQDVGVPQITLHGPPGLSEIFPATRRFVVLRDLKIKMADCSENIIFEDNVMRVRYIPLSRRQSVICLNGLKNDDAKINSEQDEGLGLAGSDKKRSRRKSSCQMENNVDIIDDDTDYYAHERKSFRKKHRGRSRSRSRSRDSESGKRTAPESISSVTQMLLRNSKEKGISMCYICRLQPRPGALNLDECVRKGVPPGPLLGKLKNGEDVVLENGTLVKSKDVCEPDDPGPVFIVVDCPSPDYIGSLVENEEFKKHQKFATADEDFAHLVIHFTPEEVMELPEYKIWMDNFTPSTEHIPVNEMNSCMGSIAVHRIQHKLNMLSSDFFPLLGDEGTPVACEDSDRRQTKRQKCEEIGVENGRNIDDSSTSHFENRYKHVNCLTSYHLRPKKGFDSTSSINLDPQEYIRETMSLDEFPSALKELQQKITFSKTNLMTRDYPKILFLGTGSCIPNKTRNTSGILLQASECQNILLDCGEGTYGQVVRFYGPEKGDKALAYIDAIYISHLHADHHIGLIGVLQGRRKALNKLNIDKGPVYLFAPKQILAWLSFYDRCFESIEDEYILVPNSELLMNQSCYPEDDKNEILEKLCLSDISTCLVKHCPNAFGVSIIHKTGYKITYSGDTMPCENLVELGKNSDVLIHEATMEDELSKEAIIKMHSTTSEAIQVGKDMQAKNTILTHFSQRYAKLPRFNNNFAENVSIAFDNMQVKLDELPLVPLLYPALKIMFAEHYEELEHKAVKRQLKLERQASAERSKAQQKNS